MLDPHGNHMHLLIIIVATVHSVTRTTQARDIKVFANKEFLVRFPRERTFRWKSFSFPLYFVLTENGLSTEMCLTYNEGCDQGNGCPTRVPLPTSACTSASVVSVLRSVCASVTCYSVVVCYSAFLNI